MPCAGDGYPGVAIIDGSRGLIVGGRLLGGLA